MKDAEELAIEELIADQIRQAIDEEVVTESVIFTSNEDQEQHGMAKDGNTNPIEVALTGAAKYAHAAITSETRVRSCCSTVYQLKTSEVS